MNKKVIIISFVIIIFFSIGKYIKSSSLKNENSMLEKNEFSDIQKLPQDQNEEVQNENSIMDKNEQILDEKLDSNNSNQNTGENNNKNTSNNIAQNNQEIISQNNENRNIIHFISTCSSDAILIESNGVYGLVDASNPYNDGTLQSFSIKQCSVSHVVDYLKKIKVNYLDFIIATHSHSDHIGGMPEIAKNFVNNKTTYYYRIYDGASDNEPSWDNVGYYNRAVSAMKSKGAKLVDVTNKVPTYKYGEISITLINTDKSVEISDNYNSIGTILRYGNVKVFLSSDIEDEDSNKIASQIGKVDILRLNHHGYSGFHKKYLSYLQPKDVIITNNAVPLESKGAIAYLKQKYDTNSYYTGSVQDSIRVVLNKDGYKLENSGAAIKYPLNSWVKWGGDYMYLKNGKFHKGWISDSGFWYYLNNDGYMIKGWNELDWSGGKDWFYFDLKNGNMLTGWQELEWTHGKNWFYFDTTNGNMLTGWQKLNWSGKESWFYFDKNSGVLIQNKCLVLDNIKYCFDAAGICSSGC